MDLIQAGKQRWVFAMRSGIQLREDYSASDLRAMARGSKDVKQSRRLLALAGVAEGRSRAEAARIGGMDRQTLRDWVHRFNGEGPSGLMDRKSPGKAPKLNKAQKARLAELVEQGPTPAVHGVVRWRCKDLVQWVREEFRIEVSEQTMGRILKELGFSHMTARPRHHAQDEQAIADFKKISPAGWQKSGTALSRAHP